MRLNPLALALLLLPATVSAQVLTSGEETITVSSTTLGVTANLCGAGNTGGAYIQVLTNAVYLALHSPSATADSGDFAISAGTGGPQFWMKPASRIRMIRQSADSSVKVQCTE